MRRKIDSEERKLPEVRSTRRIIDRDNQMEIARWRYLLMENVVYVVGGGAIDLPEP